MLFKRSFSHWCEKLENLQKLFTIINKLDIILKERKKVKKYKGEQVK